MKTLLVILLSITTQSFAIEFDPQVMMQKGLGYHSELVELSEENTRRIGQFKVILGEISQQLDTMGTGSEKLAAIYNTCSANLKNDIASYVKKERQFYAVGLMQIADSQLNTLALNVEKYLGNEDNVAANPELGEEYLEVRRVLRLKIENRVEILKSLLLRLMDTELRVGAVSFGSACDFNSLFTYDDSSAFNYIMNRVFYYKKSLSAQLPLLKVISGEYTDLLEFLASNGAIRVRRVASTWGEAKSYATKTKVYIKYNYTGIIAFKSVSSSRGPDISNPIEILKRDVFK